MPRPGYVVVGWMAATAAAVGIAYAGVSSVAGGVVEPLPPTAGMPVTGALDDTPSPTSSPATTGPSATPGSTTTGPSSPAATPSPIASSPIAAAGEVRSYALVGGSLTLRFAPGRVTVVTAEPRQGFTVEVEGDGTAEVRVEFESDDRRSRLRGTWEDGPRERVEEDADRDDGDD
jgi:hypothetical protein